MSKHKVDAVLIGNAIVDLIEEVADARLAELGIQKAIMQLVDANRSAELYAAMETSEQFAGGSAANTAAVMAELGANVHYISKTADDEIGKFFADDLARIGVRYYTPRSTDHATGKCMIFVTPDGERSMNTFLGASEYLMGEDIDFDSIWEASYLYLEGYRFDGPECQSAFKLAVERCKANDGIATITLSDEFCVDRHRDAFRDLIEHGMDIVFCNEAELISYTEASDFIAACEAVRHEAAAYIVTAGAAGCFVINHGMIEHIKAHAVEKIDSTGAGDYFAGGFLAALVNGKDYIEAARDGVRCAEEVIKVIGTRVETDLNALINGG